MLNRKLFFLVLLLVFFGACKNKSTVVDSGTKGTGIVTAPNTTPSVQTEPGIFYAGSFRVHMASSYERLLKACRRCGTRRLISNPGGGTTYQRFGVSDSDPKKCKNWNAEGFLQIHFAENRLPTSATVSIQPKYTGKEVWEKPFSIETTANAINESEGFEILIHPRDGLGGTQSLIIWSDHSNHVNQDELDVLVSYGGQGGEIIMTGTVGRRKGRSVQKAQFDCDTYTN